MRKTALFSAFLVVLLLSSSPAFAQSAERHFEFTYSFSVRNVERGQPVRVWIPLAQSDDWQQVRVISKEGDLPLKETVEPEYGNRMLYAEAAAAEKPEYHFTVKYDVLRHEHRVDVAQPMSGHAQVLAAVERRRFLQADKLVPITGKPAEIATEQVKPGMSDLEKARVFYAYTLANMRYDKSGTGWGRGDTLWSCDAKRGNCTDFHSLFISMARSQKIPSRFEIGFPIPGAKHEAEIPGYHCWMEFWLPQRGWVPLDISSAWLNPSKREYFFGAHDVNRVQFSTGRDITLSPKQDGPPLNYFVYPYVEVGGKEWPNVADAFSFADIGANGAAIRAGGSD